MAPTDIRVAKAASSLVQLSLRRLAFVLLPAMLAAACASEQAEVQQTEQMLAAAGFRMQPADTPQRQAQLAATPPRQLLTQTLQVGGKPTAGYIYADPDYCHCVYLGTPQAFQAYQQLALQQRIANEQLQAAEMQEDAAFDWGMWGPGYWGPGPVVVVHEHGYR